MGDYFDHAKTLLRMIKLSRSGLRTNEEKHDLFKKCRYLPFLFLKYGSTLSCIVDSIHSDQWKSSGSSSYYVPSNCNCKSDNSDSNRWKNQSIQFEHSNSARIRNKLRSLPPSAVLIRQPSTSSDSRSKLQDAWYQC